MDSDDRFRVQAIRDFRSFGLRLSAINSFHRNGHVFAIPRYVSISYRADFSALITVTNGYDFYAALLPRQRLTAT